MKYVNMYIYRYIFNLHIENMTVKNLSEIMKKSEKFRSFDAHIRIVCINAEIQIDF